MDKETLTDIIKQDPFYQNEIADYDITEVVPTKYDEDFSCFIEWPDKDTAGNSGLAQAGIQCFGWQFFPSLQSVLQGGVCKGEKEAKIIYRHK